MRTYNMRIKPTIKNTIPSPCKLTFYGSFYSFYDGCQEYKTNWGLKGSGAPQTYI